MASTSPGDGRQDQGTKGLMELGRVKAGLLGAEGGASGVRWGWGPATESCSQSVFAKCPSPPCWRQAMGFREVSEPSGTQRWGLWKLRPPLSGLAGGWAGCVLLPETRGSHVGLGMADTGPFRRRHSVHVPQGHTAMLGCRFPILPQDWRFAESQLGLRPLGVCQEPPLDTQREEPRAPLGRRASPPSSP